MTSVREEVPPPFSPVVGPMSDSQSLQALVRRLPDHGNRPAIVAFDKHTVFTRTSAK